MDDKMRNPYWDNFKGFIIILVVFGHFMYDAPVASWFQLPIGLIYSFHMPAFIFVSGFFGVREGSRSKDTLFKLFFAYLIFNGLMQIVASGIFDTYSLLKPIYSFWYIPALIVWRVITPYILKHSYALPLSLLAALMIGLWPDVDNTLALSRIIAFYPFFLGGSKFSYKLDAFVNKRKPIHLFIGAIAMTAGISLYLISQNIFTFTDDTFAMLPYESIYGLVCRFIIFTSASFVIFGLLLCMPSKALPFVTVWGRNSLSIYLLHRFLVVLLCYNFASNLPSSSMYLLFAVIACVAVLLLTGCNSVSALTNKLITFPSNNLKNPAIAIFIIYVITITVMPFIYALL